MISHGYKEWNRAEEAKEGQERLRQGLAPVDDSERRRLAKMTGFAVANLVAA